MKQLSSSKTSQAFIENYIRELERQIQLATSALEPLTRAKELYTIIKEQIDSILKSTGNLDTIQTQIQASLDVLTKAAPQQTRLHETIRNLNKLLTTDNIEKIDREETIDTELQRLKAMQEITALEWRTSLTILVHLSLLVMIRQK